LWAKATAHDTHVKPYETLHSVSADPINARAQAIAEDVLAETGNRATYVWETADIRLTYEGDAPDGGYGASRRLFRHPDGKWSRTAPRSRESVSPQGFRNLELEDFDGCADPVVDAKRQILFLLLDPALDLVRFAIRTWREKNAWAMDENTFEALRMRLEEVLEQLVLSNPGPARSDDLLRPTAGLDLRQIASGTHVVGWAVKTLHGTIFNIVKRMPSKLAADTAFDATAGETWTGVTQSYAQTHGALTGDLATSLGDVSEQYAALTNISELTRISERTETAKGHEKRVLQAYALQKSLSLPHLSVPDVATRKAMLAAYEQDKSLPAAAVKAYFDLIAGTPTPEQLNIDDTWLDLFRSWTSDDAYALLGAMGSYRGAADAVVLAGIGFHSPLPRASVNAARKALLGAHAAGGEAVTGKLVDAAVRAFNVWRTTDNQRAFDAAAAELVAAPGSPFESAQAVASVIQKAHEEA
jgi:hypothetical protein